jgi:glycosyltransferase involved in cell wall biosynthesis
MKAKGVKLIYEIDDYLHKVDMYSSANTMYGKNIKPKDSEKGIPNVHARCVEFYKLCDAITVTTEPLRQKLLPYNKNIFVVPNSFIMNDWKIQKQAHNSTNIFWSGSSTHYSDILEASDAVKSIIKKYENTKLVLAGWDCGDIFGEVPNDRKIIFPWTSNISEISKYNKIGDIGIIPIKENEFNECKSINKFVEYSLTDIATIATKFGPYLEIREDEGILVKNRHDKWYKAIEKLILNEVLRKQLSSNAKKRCLEEFDMSKNIINWVKVYNKVLGLNPMDGVKKNEKVV